MKRIVVLLLIAFCLANHCSCGLLFLGLLTEEVSSDTTEASYNDENNNQFSDKNNTDITNAELDEKTTELDEETLACEHNYMKSLIVEATCISAGVIEYNCSLCGNIKNETVSALGHNPNSNNTCTNCGEMCPIELDMTASEIANAMIVNSIGERTIEYLEEENKFRLMFSLKSLLGIYLEVPVIMDIKMVNNNGETVYSSQTIVKTSDYSEWTNMFGKKWTAAAIYIDCADISGGTTSKGSVSFSVYNDYLSFDTHTLTIYNNLPLKPVTIIMPELPITVNEYSYNGSVSDSVLISEVRYEMNGEDGLYFYFNGEKIYDSQGSEYSRMCMFDWKLYDSEEYVVESGTIITPKLAEGEKFKDEKAYIWQGIVPGETYKLEILSID